MATKKTKAVEKETRVLNVTPDKLDLRDRPYMPSVAVQPPPAFRVKTRVPVVNQGSTSACTGFGLAAVVGHLLRLAKREGESAVSPWMLYSMARRYDEFPGAEDAGSSLRGALKGWYKHGACALDLWKKIDMPEPTNVPGEDWWLDAVNRPLGAYYRVDTRSVTDMHVALNEVGVLYASAVVHAGWDEGVNPATPKDWAIPLRKRKESDGGHAFCIVGYDRRGFLVQNSWSEKWGDGGFATLTYEDWLANAMDCWVAQLGVVTEEHERVAQAATPPTKKGSGAALSSNDMLRRHQLAPYVIDMERDGSLSTSGSFRTTPPDVVALVTDYLDAARKDWKVKAGDPLDLVIYAHGGLTGERDAEATFSRWLPKLYEARKFPIFLMWESDILSTLANQLAHVAEMASRPAGGPLDSVGKWWNERLEGLLAPPGCALWDEMKRNASAVTEAPESGGKQLFAALRDSPVAERNPFRLHLVGHSAGAILHAMLIDRMAALEWDFETVTFLAPALRVDRFRERVLPWLQEKRIKRYRHYHLADTAEQQDPTTKALLGYGRSLLYLVSRSFEGGMEVPILGMQKHFPADVARMRSVEVCCAPSEVSRSTTHGGFDDDGATLQSVIAGLK
ncbi:peptidase C1A papain [Betaproteobacteria bacterium GR16-43]|nr:peptidase C1A papain [Betaproteobacteria bacterium GR16-43]